MKRDLLVFFGLTAVLSALFYYFLLSAGTVEAGGGLYVLGMMWSPGIAALVTMRLRRASRASVGLVWPEWGYIAAAYCIPIVYCLLAYLPLWMTGLASFYDAAAAARVARGLASIGLEDVAANWAAPVYLMAIATIGILLNLVAATGEELGWRGFLLPRLVSVTGSLPRAALLTGLIWAVWHFPGVIYTDYNNSTSTAYGLACFTVLLVAASFIMAWLRMRSRSVWPAAVLHASHNLFIQNVFDTVSGDTGSTEYLIGEFGIALCVTATLVAVLLWRRSSASAVSTSATG